MSYNQKPSGSGSSGSSGTQPNAPNNQQQMAKTLAGIQQQMQNLVHGQTGLTPTASADLNAYFHQQQRFQNMIKQQQQLLHLQQQIQQQQQQSKERGGSDRCGEPLSLTRTPAAAELLTKAYQQQQPNGSSAVNQTLNQFQQQLQAIPPNIMQQIQAFQYQMQQHQQQQQQQQSDQKQQITHSVNVSIGADSNSSSIVTSPSVPHQLTSMRNTTSQAHMLSTPQQTKSLSTAVQNLKQHYLSAVSAQSATHTSCVNKVIGLTSSSSQKEASQIMSTNLSSGTQTTAASLNSSPCASVPTPSAASTITSTDSRQVTSLMSFLPKQPGTLPIAAAFHPQSKLSSSKTISSLLQKASVSATLNSEKPTPPKTPKTTTISTNENAIVEKVLELQEKSSKTSIKHGNDGGNESHGLIFKSAGTSSSFLTPQTHPSKKVDGIKESHAPGQKTQNVNIDKSAIDDGKIISVSETQNAEADPIRAAAVITVFETKKDSKVHDTSDSSAVVGGTRKEEQIQDSKDKQLFKCEENKELVSFTIIEEKNDVDQQASKIDLSAISIPLSKPAEKEEVIGSESLSSITDAIVGSVFQEKATLNTSSTDNKAEYSISNLKSNDATDERKSTEAIGISKEMEQIEDGSAGKKVEKKTKSIEKISKEEISNGNKKMDATFTDDAQNRRARRQLKADKETTSSDTESNVNVKRTETEIYHSQRSENNKIEEIIQPTHSGVTTHKERNSTLNDRKSQRHRLKTILYQSPLPELAYITKLSASEASNSPKPTQSIDDKLILFYKNEYVALRNAEGTFYICQAMQNVYRSSPRINIRWLSEDPKEANIYVPDFYDHTDLDCVLTSVDMKRVDKGHMRLPESEKTRIDSILKKAIDLEKGLVPTPYLAEENPDGLDISLYKDESQIEKKAYTHIVMRSSSGLRKRRSNAKVKSAPSSKCRQKKNLCDKGTTIEKLREQTTKKRKFISKQKKKLKGTTTSDEDNVSSDDSQLDVEYKPNQKKTVNVSISKTSPRSQRSPLAKARAASPLTPTTSRSKPVTSKITTAPLPTSRRERANKRKLVPNTPIHRTESLKKRSIKSTLTPMTSSFDIKHCSKTLHSKNRARNSAVVSVTASESTSNIKNEKFSNVEGCLDYSSAAAPSANISSSGSNRLTRSQK